MKLQTRGEFGGLGFVVGSRDGNITVIKVLKGTPAQKAGIRAKDVISRIGEQSTVNMDVLDAVDRLRGKPGTPVTITVERAAWPEPKKLERDPRDDQRRDGAAGQAARPATSATCASPSSPATAPATCCRPSTSRRPRPAAASRG